MFDKKSGKKLSVFDLGFQAIYTRSNLFQLLGIFSKEKISYKFILTLFNKYINSILYTNKNNPAEKITYYPRITYDKTVVLRRKYWIVHKNCLPKFDSDIDCFIYFNEWRRMYGLPDEVFVKISKRDRSLTKIEPKNLSRDNYKPQYINFNSPLLVNYFCKLTQRIQDDFFSIEEMLPNSQQLITVNGEKTVTEFIFQWNCHG